MRMRRQASTLLFQALWRGYQVRKSLQAVALCSSLQAVALWSSLDEAYRLCVLCQDLAVILHYADKSWDATETPWYVWMLTQGRYLEALEVFLEKRGWVRPPQGPLATSKAFLWTREVYRLYQRGYYAPPFSPLLPSYRPYD